MAKKKPIQTYLSDESRERMNKYITEKLEGDGWIVSESGAVDMLIKKLIRLEKLQNT